MISSIGGRIADARHRSSLTQAIIAEKLGVSRSLVGQIEKDLTKPNLEFLVGFVRITNTTLDYLILGIDQPEADARAGFTSVQTDHQPLTKLLLDDLTIIQSLVNTLLSLKVIESGKAVLSKNDRNELLEPYFAFKKELNDELKKKADSLEADPNRINYLGSMAMHVTIHYVSELKFSSLKISNTLGKEKKMSLEPDIDLNEVFKAWEAATSGD